MNKTEIEWTDMTWNAIKGCTNGCPYCYARGISNRFGWPFEPRYFEHKLDEPAKRKKPAKIFVCSMGEVFDSARPRWHIEKVWQEMANNERHTFQILTKRPDIMAEIVSTLPHLKNVWLGTSITSQGDAEIRIPLLLDTEAAVRFISIEPMLAAVDIRKWVNDLDWVLVGGLTGRKLQKPATEWIDDIAEACDSLGVPLLIKGNAGYRVNRREFPTSPVKRQCLS